MVNTILVDILVNKIRIGDINPNTGEPFKVENIKIEEYKTDVEAKLNITQ